VPATGLVTVPMGQGLTGYGRWGELPLLAGVLLGLVKRLTTPGISWRPVRRMDPFNL